MIRTYEALYENGVIRLADDVRLPEHTKVYVVVPEAVEESDYRINSPRLVHPHQAADFVKEVVEEDSDVSPR
ncbi:MAG TPA: antitoxin family protein [Chthonomonadaceae bacterium]|nr:antitoxin family protein [Chthonomonadaceae bacterium]